MTRQTGEIIEYQILYLPKSSSAEDFTVFDWAGDILKVWDQLTATLVPQNRDMSTFKKGPWSVFGITNKTIQSRIASENAATVVTGILRCPSDSAAPSSENFKDYLNFQPSDFPFEWIITAMMNEAIPYYYSQHVSDGCVYWVDGRTGLSTWAHPWYGKYLGILKSARRTKPLSDWKSVAHFQLRCLIDSIPDSAPIESLDNITEVARVFGVNLQEEPYLVHLMKAALRYYALVEKQSASLKTVEDFRIQIDRRRREVKLLTNSVATLKKTADSLSTCVECETARATVHCADCEDYFCAACFDKIHASGSRKLSHSKTIVEMTLCAECCSQIAGVHCVNCFDLFCTVCFEKLHSRGGRRNHTAVVTRRDSAGAASNPQATQTLARAQSPWIQLVDEEGVGVYTNVVTHESRRDRPLAVINSA